MKQLTAILERDDSGEIGGSVHVEGHFLQTTVGKSESEVLANLRDLIADYIAHEGADFPEWKDVDATQIKFNVEYDLTAFFTAFSAVKIGAIAQLAGINAALMRQYASGVKSASAAQVAKVEATVRKLGEQLVRVSLTSAG